LEKCYNLSLSVAKEEAAETLLSVLTGREKDRRGGFYDKKMIFAIRQLADEFKGLE